MQVTITPDEVARHHPDVLLPPDPECGDLYWQRVLAGRQAAKDAKVALVAICRNAMPWLPKTLELVREVGEGFRDWSCFIYENDSTDGTKEFLADWAREPRLVASMTDNGRPHLNYTTEPVRTHALAEYRTECQRYAAGISGLDFVIVFDTDPWGGFSVDGVFNSIGWMAGDTATHAAAMMASYSWCEWGLPVASRPFAAHYDAFAARLNDWKQRDQMWFHHWSPPIGSQPVQFFSAFGQLAVYRADYYQRGRYTGEDCEHVTHARTMGGRVYLNPSSRCVAFWIPEEAKQDGGQHG